MHRCTQHRHRCVDIRIVLNRIAAIVPSMEEDKDDSNDSQDGGVYSTMAIPTTRATPCMHSADNVYLSRH